jgi:hypothetical protein
MHFGASYFRKGIVMKLTRYLIPPLVTAPAVFGLIVATPATADCSSSGYATVCAQGDVRGGGGGSTVSGPVYPYDCADDWLCNDGVDINWGPIWNPGGPGGPGGPGRPGGPGGPGRPGGIGPR